MLPQEHIELVLGGKGAAVSKSHPGHAVARLWPV
jgi:hypothetical protein